MWSTTSFCRVVVADSARMSLWQVVRWTSCACRPTYTSSWRRRWGSSSSRGCGRSECCSPGDTSVWGRPLRPCCSALWERVRSSVCFRFRPSCRPAGQARTHRRPHRRGGRLLHHRGPRPARARAAQPPRSPCSQAVLLLGLRGARRDQTRRSMRHNSTWCRHSFGPCSRRALGAAQHAGGVRPAAVRLVSRPASSPVRRQADEVRAEVVFPGAAPGPADWLPADAGPPGRRRSGVACSPASRCRGRRVSG